MKLKEHMVKYVNKEDWNSIVNMFFYILTYGLLINFSFLVIFGIKFSWYSFFAWGIALWFIENKLIKFLRNIIHK